MAIEINNIDINNQLRIRIIQIKRQKMITSLIIIVMYIALILQNITNAITIA